MNLLDRARALFADYPWVSALANGEFNLTVVWPFVKGNGKSGLQSRFLVQDGVAVVALDCDTRQAFLISQKRIAAPHGNIDSIEFPCGGQNEGETIIQAGLRELREESGVAPTKDVQIFVLFANKNPVIGPVVTAQHAILVTSARRLHEPTDDEADKIFTMPLREIAAGRNNPAMVDPLLSFSLAMLAIEVLQKNGLEALIT